MNNTIRGSLLLLLTLGIFLQCAAASEQYKLQSGKIYFRVKQTPSSSPELFQFNYDSSIKSELRLTQSSKIEVEAKVIPVSNSA